MRGDKVVRVVGVDTSDIGLCAIILICIACHSCSMMNSLHKIAGKLHKPNAAEIVEEKK